MPDLRARSTIDFVCSANSVFEANRVAATVVLMPPDAYLPPAIRAT